MLPGGTPREPGRKEARPPVQATPPKPVATAPISAPKPKRAPNAAAPPIEPRARKLIRTAAPKPPESPRDCIHTATSAQTAPSPRRAAPTPAMTQEPPAREASQSSPTPQKAPVESSRELVAALARSLTDRNAASAAPEVSPGPTTGMATGTVQFGSDEGPSSLKRAAIEYPRGALRADRQGRVVMLLKLDDRGTLLRADIAESAGPRLDRAALRFARASTYAPRRPQGAPRAVQGAVAHHLQSAPVSMPLFDYILLGGPLMWPVVFCSVIALAIGQHKSTRLLRVRAELRSASPAPLRLSAFATGPSATPRQTLHDLERGLGSLGLIAATALGGDETGGLFLACLGDDDDVDYGGVATSPVQHRVGAVGDLDACNVFHGHQAGIELAVESGVQRNAVEQQGHMAGTHPANVDAGRSVIGGANMQAGQECDGLIQGSRAGFLNVICAGFADRGGLFRHGGLFPGHHDFAE